MLSGYHNKFRADPGFKKKQGGGGGGPGNCEVLKCSVLKCLRTISFPSFRNLGSPGLSPSPAYPHLPSSKIIALKGFTLLAVTF